MGPLAWARTCFACSSSTLSLEENSDVDCARAGRGAPKASTHTACEAHTAPTSADSDDLVDVAKGCERAGLLEALTSSASPFTVGATAADVPHLNDQSAEKLHMRESSASTLSPGSASKRRRSSCGSARLNSALLFGAVHLSKLLDLRDAVSQLRLLGAGGHGVVLSGMWQLAPVAIKLTISPPGLAACLRPESLLEGPLSKSLRAPNVVETYSFSCTLLTSEQMAACREADERRNDELLTTSMSSTGWGGLNELSFVLSGSCTQLQRQEEQQQSGDNALHPAPSDCGTGASPPFFTPLATVGDLQPAQPGLYTSAAQPGAAAGPPDPLALQLHEQVTWHGQPPLPVQPALLCCQSGHVTWQPGAPPPPPPQPYSLLDAFHCSEPSASLAVYGRASAGSERPWAAQATRGSAPSLAALLLRRHAHPLGGGSPHRTASYSSAEGFDCGPAGAQRPQGALSYSDALHLAGALPGCYLTQLVMELCDLGSMHAHIRKGAYSGAALDRARMFAFTRTLRDIAAGCSYLHYNRIIHGDLKPANIMLRSSRVDARGYTAKVADFGLSQRAPGGPGDGSGSGRGGRRGPAVAARWSSLPYMAPEHFGGTLLPASDVWSFAALAVEMWTGAVPYSGMGLDATALCAGVCSGVLAPELPADMPPDLRALLAACLAPTWRRRPGFPAIRTALRDIEAAHCGVMG